MSAVYIRVLYKDILQNTIVHLPPILVRSAGDDRRGGCIEGRGE